MGRKRKQGRDRHLAAARDILGAALGPPDRHPPPKHPPLSTGSAVLDHLIGGAPHACDGYPGGRIVQVGIPAAHLDPVRRVLLKTHGRPVTLVSASAPPPDDLPDNVEPPPDHPSLRGAEMPHGAVAATWLALSNPHDGPRIVALDDVRLGTRGDASASLTATWGAFLPKAKSRANATGHALLGFSKVVPHYRAGDPEWGIPENALDVHGGKPWRAYTSLTMFVRPSDVAPDALAVSLWKNKCSPSQGESILLAVRDGEIDDDATVALLSSTLGTDASDVPSAVACARDRGVPLPDVF